LTRQHAFDAFVGSWRESTKVDLRSAFHSASREEGYNYGLYANPEVDALIDRARAEADPAVAGPLWRQAQRRIVADAPYTFIFERDRLHAVPRGLAGFTPSPRSAFVGLADWRLPGEHQARP
jgi:ABC-type transport system substrate-binding protein